MITIFIWIVMIMIILSIVVGSWRNGISPMPTSNKVKKHLLKHLPTTISGKVYELGSGWGTLAFPLAHFYKNCSIIGLETSFIPLAFSKLRLFFETLPNLKFECRDIYIDPLKEASLIICYLYPGAMKKLKKKFEKELQSGTWVITNTFSIPGWIPEKVVEVTDLYRTKIYVYRIK